MRLGKVLPVFSPRRSDPRTDPRGPTFTRDVIMLSSQLCRNAEIDPVWPSTINLFNQC